MDGNGRWATQRGLPREYGHSKGAEKFREIARYCGDIGIGKVERNIPSTLDEKQIKALKEIFGDEFVSTADYDPL